MNEVLYDKIGWVGGWVGLRTEVVHFKKGVVCLVLLQFAAGKRVGDAGAFLWVGGWVGGWMD